VTGPALTLAAALVIVFVGALVLDWWEDRRDWREWQQDHEPPSRLDRLDGLGGGDPWRP
jgi:hypothetical protein